MKLVLAPPSVLPGRRPGEVPGPLGVRQQRFVDTLRDPAHLSGQMVEMLLDTLDDAREEGAPRAACGAVHPQQTRGEDEFDDYFGVVRETDPGPGSFAASLFAGYRSLVEEASTVGTRLTWAEWAVMCSAFQAMMCFPDESVPALRPVLSTPPMMGTNVDAQRRWVVGHQVFLVLIQALVVALNVYREARRRGDLDAARHGLVGAGRVMAASGSALVFASEFAPGQYAARIRPSMQEPHVSAGFSGLLSADHRHLIRLLAELKPTFADLPPELVPAHSSLVSALAGAYDSHKYVCARFGGGHGVSLRMSARSAFTAVDVIHGLKMARSKSVRAS